jgi:hypothetical protein
VRAHRTFVTNLAAAAAEVQVALVVAALSVVRDAAAAT